MTVYVLDTNIISLVLRHQMQVRNRLDAVLTTQNSMLICPIVWYELRRGLLARSAKNQLARLENLLAEFDWQDYTLSDWSLAATLWAERRAKGLPISDADLLIGVFARNREAILVTDNTKDFGSLGVLVENWM